MKRILSTLILFVGLALSANAQDLYYKNFGPAQPLMDSLFEQLINTVPPPHSLLYDKAIHPGYFMYCDGDLYTDTLDIEDLYQYYTEVIDMNTKGILGYEQFVPLVDMDSINTSISSIGKRNAITFLNYKYSGIRSDVVFDNGAVDSTNALFKVGARYYLDSLSPSDVYMENRLMAASPAYNEFDNLSSNVLWFNPATYYGNDSNINYSPIINFGNGFVKYNWNDTVLIPSYIDTSEIVIQIGLIKPRGDVYDTLYANTYMSQRFATVYTQNSGTAKIELPSIVPKPLSY
jgi:hypothetical protein